MKMLVGLFLAVVLMGSVAWAEEEPAITMEEGMEHILEHYLTIRSSLASDSLKGVKEDAGHIIEMADELAKIKHDTTEEENKKHQEKIADLKVQAEKLKGEKIEDARQGFSGLSNHLIECLTKCSTPEKEYYVYYCSMVKKHWIQENKEIGNPYYGSKMLKCGELQKTIGGKSKGGHEEHKEGEKGHEHSQKDACPFTKSEEKAKENKGCCPM